MFMHPSGLCHRVRVHRQREPGGAPIISSALAATPFMSAMEPRISAAVCASL
jgi:hypothetical protein